MKERMQSREREMDGAKGNYNWLYILFLQVTHATGTHVLL